MLKNADTTCPTGDGSISDRTCTPASTVVGYMGGMYPYPTYQNYTDGDNYSETLRIEYDPTVTSYSDLLNAYWQFTPDPTQQCGDPAYCLRIFTVTPEQHKLAVASAVVQSNKFGAPLFVDIDNASEYTFWKAEEYHQKYFEKAGQACNSKF